MAEFREYIIDILINDSELDAFPKNNYFILSDSIHKFYSTGELTIKDTAGLFHEYGLGIPGEKISIEYGLVDADTTKNLFIINKSDSDNNNTAGYINGNLNLYLIHNFLDVQTIESQALEDVTSAFIEQVVSDFEFEEVIIEPTDDSDIWYRPLLTQEELIQVLKEKAYSRNSEMTPFFAFIDSNNTFHFESWLSMFNKEPTAELLYSPNRQEDFSQNNIYEFIPFSDDTRAIHKARNVREYFTSSEDGTLIQQVNSLLTLPENPPTDQVALVGSSEYVTDYRFRWEQEDSETEYLDQGKTANLFRNTYNLEKVYVRLPLNAALLAGKTVTIQTVTLEESGKNTFSGYYTGKYLIERSNHIWDGPNENQYTELVISRRYLDLSDNYLISERLYA
jgi:hypothetical protein